MRTEHLEILVEEPSMEFFLRELLPGLIGNDVTFRLFPSQGKHDLLRNLPARLKAYARWLPEGWRVIVLLDRDDDDCAELKSLMESAALDAGLRTRATDGEAWQVVNRIAIEELEAWYFGDWDAVLEAYPKVPKNVAERAAYRDPDGIQGGTWEAFERVLRKAGYFESGLRKREIARVLGKRVVPARNRSRSFAAFRDTLLQAVQ